jgi:hypothetical protein
VFEGGRQLFHLVEAKGDIVGDVTLVSANLKGLSKLVLGCFIFLFFVENATLSNNSFCGLWRQLSNERLCVSHFFKFILDMNLNLNNLVSVLRILNLRCNFTSLNIHAGFKKGLRMVEFVLSHVRIEFCKLVIVFRCFGVVLNVEIAVGE